MERGNSSGTPHHLTSRWQESFPLFEAACDNVDGRTGLFETPTHQNSIVTPPTGFRASARDNVCKLQRVEEGGSGHQTTPLTTTRKQGKGLVKEDSAMHHSQHDSSTAPLQSVSPPNEPLATTPPSTVLHSTTPPLIDSPPAAAPPTMTPLPTAPPTVTHPAVAPPTVTPPPTAPPTVTHPAVAPPTVTLPHTAPPTVTHPAVAPSTVTPPVDTPMTVSDTVYKALYHGALERLHAESTGLAAFRRLVPLVAQLNTVKTEHMTQVQKTFEELELCRSAVEKKIKEWTEEREAYRAEGERTVATLVAELVACNATNKVLGERLEAVNKELVATQARLHASEDLSARLQGRLLHKRKQLEACATETHELKEFTELEKQTLDDTVVEMQKQLRDREYDLLTQSSRHREEASRLQEEVERLKFQLKRESIKSYRYQTFSDRFVEHIQGMQSREDGKKGLSVELDSDTVRRTLAQWRAISLPKGVENIAPEGAEQERERVKLATQVQELNDKLCVGMAEYCRLKQMFHNYQAKSVEKVEILKCNLEKADQEIYQLDDIVDKVVKVMQENMATVRECPPLHSILQELLGAQET